MPEVAMPPSRHSGPHDEPGGRRQWPITVYAPLADVLADLVQRAPDLPVWSLHPWTHGEHLTVDVLASTREAVAAWAGVLGGHDEHAAEATGRLPCEATGCVAGVSVRVLAIVDAPADERAEAAGDVAAVVAA